MSDLPTIRCDSEGVPCVVQSVWVYRGDYKAELFTGEVLEFYDYAIELIAGKPLKYIPEEKVAVWVEILAERKYWERQREVRR